MYLLLLFFSPTPVVSLWVGLVQTNETWISIFIYILLFAENTQDSTNVKETEGITPKTRRGSSEAEHSTMKQPRKLIPVDFDLKVTIYSSSNDLFLYSTRTEAYSRVLEFLFYLGVLTLPFIFAKTLIRV